MKKNEIDHFHFCVIHYNYKNVSGSWRRRQIINSALSFLFFFFSCDISACKFVHAYVIFTMVDARPRELAFDFKMATKSLRVLT